MQRLDEFMAEANAAYYAGHDPFADFTTAPEITQVFGELLGAWATVCWQAMGRPDPVILAEAGPGRGTLMADARRLIARVAPDFAAAARLHLVETSPHLRAAQAARLSDATWHDRIEALPAGPLILLGNEFLDALPIRQFIRRDAGWTERFVDQAGFVECPAEPPADVPETEPGQMVELCDAARDLARHLARRLAAQGGVALFVDYGPEHSAAGESLQAIRDGKAADPLEAPGSADLTAHVDFAALARAARDEGAMVAGPVPQGMFLVRLGLFQRSGQLARHLPPREASAVMEAAKRLAEPDRMGRLFKVLAICHPSLPIPAGFEP